MVDGADFARQAGWPGVLDAVLARFQREGIRVRELCLLYVLSFLLVVAVVVLFFVPLVWIFS